MTYRVWKQLESVKDYIKFNNITDSKQHAKSEVCRGIIDRAWVTDDAGTTIYECSLDITGRLCVSIDYTGDEQLESQIRTLHHTLQSKRNQYDTLVTQYAELERNFNQVEKEKQNLLLQRNQLLTLLTKEQIIELYMASQSQTQ